LIVPVFLFSMGIKDVAWTAKWYPNIVLQYADNLFDFAVISVLMGLAHLVFLFVTSVMAIRQSVWLAQDRWAHYRRSVLLVYLGYLLLLSLWYAFLSLATFPL
jgi:cytochrome c biogenesis protein CcdA